MKMNCASISYMKSSCCFAPQVLITKLRSATSAETQQYRKAAKALLVLIPLLGITYILVIVGPAEGISRSIYDGVRAVLLSTQVSSWITEKIFFANRIFCQELWTYITLFPLNSVFLLKLSDLSSFLYWNLLSRIFKCF